MIAFEVVHLLGVQFVEVQSPLRGTHAAFLAFRVGVPHLVHDTGHVIGGHAVVVQHEPERFLIVSCEGTARSELTVAPGPDALEVGLSHRQRVLVLDLVDVVGLAGEPGAVLHVACHDRAGDHTMHVTFTELFHKIVDAVDAVAAHHVVADVVDLIETTDAHVLAPLQELGELVLHLDSNCPDVLVGGVGDVPPHGHSDHPVELRTLVDAVLPEHTLTLTLEPLRVRLVVDAV